MDAISSLLTRLGPRARLFFTGCLRQSADFDHDPANQTGFIHVLRGGAVDVDFGGRERVLLDRPTLLLLPRHQPHSFHPDPALGADLVCSRVVFDGGDWNPVLLGMPPRLTIALSELAGLDGALALIFDEAANDRLGRAVMLDRLMEVLIALLLRHLAETDPRAGALAGMADPRLARALAVMHAEPARDWTLDRLAEVAGMSRASFAGVFKSVVGVPPGDYLITTRLAIAKSALDAGRSLKAAAVAAGYASPSALARALRRRGAGETTPQDTAS